MSRSGESNYDRFPIRRVDEGVYDCRMCGARLSGLKRSFCGRRCLRDFFMQTEWARVRKVIFHRDGQICMKCGRRLKEDDFHVDHIVPLAKGGAEWDLSNLELSCAPCNLSKGARVPDERQQSLFD